MRIEKKLLCGPITIKQWLLESHFSPLDWIGPMIPFSHESGKDTMKWYTNPDYIQWHLENIRRVVYYLPKEDELVYENYNFIVSPGVIVENNGAVLTKDTHNNELIYAGRGQRRDPYGGGYELPWDNPWYLPDDMIDPFIPEDGYPTEDTVDSLLEETVTVWDVQIPYVLIYCGYSFSGSPPYDPQPNGLTWKTDHIHELRLIRRPRGGPPEE